MEQLFQLLHHTATDGYNDLSNLIATLIKDVVAAEVKPTAAVVTMYVQLHRLSIYFVDDGALTRRALAVFD